MFQIEFYATKTEELGKQRTLKELQERKLVQLEFQCDQLRAENNVSVDTRVHITLCCFLLLKYLCATYMYMYTYMCIL